MSGYLRTVDGNEHQVGEIRTPIECFRCGVCCAGYQPQLTPEEIENIAKGLKVSTEDFLSRYAQSTHIGYLLRQSERGCVFLSWEKDGTRASCTIHPFRPKTCRDWVPSLSRRECLEGLTRMKTKGRIMLAEELYPSQESLVRFSEQVSINDR